MTLSALRSMTEEDRRKIIIEFIREHQSCSAEALVQGVKDDISRVKVFDILHELLENGAVQNQLENEKKRNSRQYRLFVNEGNPLVSVRSELDNFERAYFDLLSKAMMEFESRIEDARKAILDIGENIVVDPKASDEASEMTIATLKKLDDIGNRAILDFAWLIVGLMKVFYSMVDACLFRFLFIWSQKIPDRRVLQQLYSMVFSRIADMQTRVSEILNSSNYVGLNDTARGTLIKDGFRTVDGRGPLERFLQNFREIGKEKEIEPVIGSLWNIIGELQPNVYPEPKLYGWPFKYGEDDWRKLVRLLKQHPESSPHGKDKS